MSHRAGDGHASSVRCGDGRHDGQAKSGSAGRPVGACSTVTLEDALLGFGSDPHAVIAHPDPDVLVLRRGADGRFRHIPVVDGTQLVGLISIGDVVKARLSELAMEVDALEGMIKGF